MAQKNITYEGLQKDSDFLSSAYHSLRALGENPSPNNPKEIVDTFLTKRRWFNANLGATVNQSRTILNDFSPDLLTVYQHAVDKVDAMPNFGDGAAPEWEAAGDYIYAGITDPFNILSGLASFFTFGGAGAAGIATKEAAKLGFKKGLEAKIKSLISKEGRQRLAQTGKVLAVEGSTAGAGEAYRENLSQDVEIATGKRTEKDYGNIALHGAIGTVAGPAIGATASQGYKVVKNVLGSEILKQVSSEVAESVGTQLSKTGLGEKFVDNISQIPQVTNTLINNIIPAAQRDELSTRVFERVTGETKPLEEVAEKISIKINKEIKANFKEEGDVALINKAMEGNRQALNTIGNRSVELQNTIKEWQETVGKLQDIAGAGKFISAKIKGKYKYNPDKPYARDIYDRYISSRKEPFNKFIENNPDLLQELREELLADAATKDKKWATKANLIRDGELKPEIDIDEYVEEFAKKQYSSVLNKKRKLGPLDKRKEIPKAVQAIWGKNNQPAIRALETAKGIVDSSTQMRLASSLAESLLARGVAKKITDADGPPPKDMVKLVSGFDPEGKVSDALSPFALSKNILTKDINEIYIDKNQASIIKNLVEGFDSRLIDLEADTGLKRFGQSVVNVISATQGRLKKAKTIYNPYAHIRNATGATSYVIGSGNYGGLKDIVEFYGKNIKNPEARQEMWNMMSRMGLKGSQVELNQIFTRLAELDKGRGNIAEEFAVAVGTGGQNYIEKIPGIDKTIKGLENMYMFTDDFAKMATFFRERKRADTIWNNSSDEIKQQKRKNFSNAFLGGKIIPGEQNALAKFDKELLDEQAVAKAMQLVPVYSRIPALVEKMRGLPVLGNFAAFPAENLRNKYNLFKISGQEIQEGIATGNKSLVNAGLNRLASQSVVAGSAYTGAYFYNLYNDTQKYMPSVRNTLPEWERNGAITIRKDNKGKIYYQNHSYSNPDQYVLDFIMPFILDMGEGRNIDESLFDTITGIASRQLEPFFGKSLTVEALKYLYDYTSTKDLQQEANALASYYKVVEPGFLKPIRELAFESGFADSNEYLSSLDRSLKRVLPGEKQLRLTDTTLREDLRRLGVPGADLAAGKGENVSAWEIMAQINPFSWGIKEREFDPKKQITYATRTLARNSENDYNDVVQEINSMLNASAQKPNLKSIGKMYREAMEEKFGAAQQIYTLHTSFKGFMSQRELRDLAMNKVARGQLSKQDMRYILRNQFNTPRLSRNKNLISTIREANKNREEDRIDIVDVRKILSKVESDFGGRSLSRNVEEQKEEE